ncbi:efflux RND transporter periplasmic adaptor subunit [Patescibacteria group bacterium]|nr:efflux RND transporter periplasmic adaptor subunit [Patescibacteria group bacterium]
MKNIITLFRKRPILYSVILVVVVIVIYIVASGNKSSGYQYVTVSEGSITQDVTVTGNTTPVSSVDMAFQNSGTIAAVNYDVGSHVSAGDVVVRLDTSGLEAQLAQAQANVDTQQANLALLEAGATQQDIQVSEAAVAAAEQSLANDYMDIPTTVEQAYSSANDAVRNKLAPMFNGITTSNPSLTFQASNQQIINQVELEVNQVVRGLNSWQEELGSIDTNSSTSTLDKIASDAGSYLDGIQSFLTDMTTAVNDAYGLSSSAATYQADVTAAVAEVNTAIADLNTATQAIASQKAVVGQQVAALNLKLAGSTPQAIQAQQAQVEQAEASVKNIEVSIAQASLVAPISGVITVQNGKVSQVASAGETIFSIISGNNLEVDSDVPEIDIGKVNVGDPVTMTLDAFPGEQFTGKVFYIDPAQTVIQGVVDYLVKVSFDKPDPRIKSGLTVNLTIDTKTDNNALILPQYAVLQNDSGSFVEIVSGNKIVQVPVTLGIQDDNGNIEILSGVTAGERVLNIGLKQ